MSDIVLSAKRKINIFDRVIQSIVIMVNMNKMNRAIDEHLQVIHRTEREDEKEAAENILREIVFVKYQYDIMQRQMYELKISYPDEIVDNINSTDKTERLTLQKAFLESEYDRLTKIRFKSREDLKYSLLIISSVIDTVKQNIKDEGKSRRYNSVIKLAENIDEKIHLNEYSEELYKELFENVDEYVDYINDNYDISKLPTDERELIEFVIETIIKGVESDIDRHMYEYNLIVNICKSSYRYFKIIDKIFEKLQKIYDESLEKEIINLKDYMKMYKEIYDSKIKTKVNDVHRTIKTEDEYLEYSRMIANSEDEKLEQFLLERALETVVLEGTKKLLNDELKTYYNEEIEDEENLNDVINADLETKNDNIEESIVEENVEDKKEIEKKVKEKPKKVTTVKKTTAKKVVEKKSKDEGEVKPVRRTRRVKND